MYIYICMQNHNDNTIKTSDTVLRKIYLSLYLKGVVCERELETEQNCNILTPTLLVITEFLSRSPGLLDRGLGGPASLGAGFLYCILSSTHLIRNWLIGGLRAPSTCHQLIEFLVHWVYIIVSTFTFFLWASQIALIQRSRLYSAIPQPDAPVYLHRWISYFDCLGRVVGQYATVWRLNIL